MANRPTSCAQCKKNFAPGDDIVICPECGAPYHRACYTEAGQCRFSDKHGTHFEYQDENKNSAASQNSAAEPPNAAGSAQAPSGNFSAQQIACQKCGTMNNKQNIFCESCGHPLHSQAPNPNMGSWQNTPQGGRSPFGGSPFMQNNPAAFAQTMPDIDGIPAKDWATYIGNQAPNYIFRMSAQQQRKSKIGVIFSVFLLGPYYFAYRKMWGWAALSFLCWVIFAIPTVVSVLMYLESPLVATLTLSTFENITRITWILEVISMVLFSLFSVYLFRKSTGKRIRKIKKNSVDEAAYQLNLKKASGPSIAGVVVVVIIQMALVYALPFLVGVDLPTFLSALLAL